MVRFLNIKEQQNGGTAIKECEGHVMVLDFEEGFCWDHGHHFGPRCPRCRPDNGEAQMSRRPRNGGNLAE